MAIHWYKYTHNYYFVQSKLDIDPGIETEMILYNTLLTQHITTFQLTVTASLLRALTQSRALS